MVKRLVIPIFGLLIGVSVFAQTERIILYETINKKYIPMGIDLTPNDDCFADIQRTKIVDVEYETGGMRVNGFRAPIRGNDKDSPIAFWSISPEKKLYEKLPNAERGDVNRVIKKDAVVDVVYYTCGNGGYIYVDKVFLAKNR